MMNGDGMDRYRRVAFLLKISWVHDGVGTGGAGSWDMLVRDGLRWLFFFFDIYIFFDWLMTW